MRYEGLQTRTEGYPGIRSLYTVDEAALLSLSEDYRVSIGALMAIGDVRSGNTTAFPRSRNKRNVNQNLQIKQKSPCKISCTGIFLTEG